MKMQAMHNNCSEGKISFDEIENDNINDKSVINQSDIFILYPVD